MRAPRRRRLLLAAIIAPAAPVIMILVPQLTGHARLNLTDWGDDLVLVMILCGAYALSLLLGVPAYLIVRRLRRQSAPIYLLAGFCIGAVSIPLVILGIFSWALLSRGFEKLIVIASPFAREADKVLGASVGIGLLFAPIGLLFWFIARPNQNP